MNEKFFLVAMVAFLIAGVLAYDHYITEKGQIGPMGRLLDFAGLSKKDAAFHARTTKTIRAKYRLDLESDLQRLRETHQKIESQRVNLVLHRRAILEQLAALDGQVNQEAQKYTDALKQEQTEFLNRFPQIEQIGSSLLQNQAQPDAVLRQAGYAQNRQELSNFLKEVGGPNPPDEVSGLQIPLEKIDLVFFRSQKGGPGMPGRRKMPDRRRQ